METLKESLFIQEVKNGSIVSPQGFSAGGVHAGLRYAKKDIGMIVSEAPANCAAVYTQNHFQAAPLHVTKDSLAASGGQLQAVLVNSACANACTGEQGLQDAYKMRELAAKKLQVEDSLVAVASTGVIGEFLPMVKIADGIEMLTLSNGTEAAEGFGTAILTSDTCQKNSCFTAKISNKTVYMGGAAKGSGMIHPNMATMLAFLTTDVNIPTDHLQEALREVTNVTFNQITVDGDTSTNDMVLVMANGQAGNEPLTPAHPDWSVFVELLMKTCESLAKQIAKDGEGATKLVEVKVTGASSHDDAKQIAKQIIGSNLVKTALFGADANWGRIISAIGQTNCSFEQNNVTVAIGPMKMVEKSTPIPFSEEEAKHYLQGDFIEIMIDLNSGAGEGKAWGCDLSYEYVRINASYRT